MNQFQRLKLTTEELAAHDAAVKARQLEYRKNWRKRNAVRYYAMQNERRKKNPERTKALSDKYRAKNAEKIRAYANNRLKTNPDAVRAIRKRSYEKKKAIRHEKWAFKDALRRGCFIGDRSLIIPMYEYAVHMQRTTGVRWSVDHIIPLALGGAHDAANMQPMPLDLNHTKSGNPFWICSDGKWRDWRSVPFHIWPEKLKVIYDSVIAHNQASLNWISMSA